MMAQHASAKKRIRQTKRRTVVNRARVSRIRTFLRRVETAIAGGRQDEAVAAYNKAQPELMRGANKGVVHRNLVARKLSRLAQRIKTMPS
jgi:small subunit ribosomal protein S20